MGFLRPALSVLFRNDNSLLPLSTVRFSTNIPSSQGCLKTAKGAMLYVERAAHGGQMKNNNNKNKLT